MFCIWFFYVPCKHSKQLPLEFPVSFSTHPSTEGPVIFLVNGWLEDLQTSPDFKFQAKITVNMTYLLIFVVLVVVVLCWKGCNPLRCALLDLRIWSMMIYLFWFVAPTTKFLKHSIARYCISLSILELEVFPSLMVLQARWNWPFSDTCIILYPTYKRLNSCNDNVYIQSFCA